MSPSRTQPALAALAALALAACTLSGPLVTGPYADSFTGPAGTLPEGWRVDTTNGGGGADGRWELVADATAPTAPGALALVDAAGHRGQQFNLCWLESYLLGDLEARVQVRADGGVEDQGGGLAWRIDGEDDYYAARWNPLEDNFRVYSVVDGVRLQLDTARVICDPAAWHEIRVVHVGDTITCWFDGQELLHATDAELTEAGGVGLWTKADATTSFDGFAFAPVE